MPRLLVSSLLARLVLPGLMLPGACTKPPVQRVKPTVEARVSDVGPSQELAETVVAVALTEQSAEMQAIATGKLKQVVKVGTSVKEGVSLGHVLAPDVSRAAAEARAQARQAKAELDRAQAELKQAEQRLEARSAADVVSKDERQGAQSAVQIASASVEIAREKVEQAREREESAKYKLEQLDLIAPFDGVVALWYRSDRSTVEAGSKLVRFVGQATPLIRFALAAARASRVNVGDMASFVWEKGSQDITISRVAAEADPHSGLVIVEGSLVTPSVPIRPGTAGRVQLRAEVAPPPEN